MHHIDEKGQDAGVVYSEMQGRENTSGDLMALRFIVIPEYTNPCLTSGFIGCNVCLIHLVVAIEVRQVV